MTLVDEVVVRELGRTRYAESFAAMKAFTAARSESTPDEIWLLEHEPVYTVGQGSNAVARQPSGIPLVKSDRGGDITYHGPGQLVVYGLIDLARRGITVKPYVRLLEQCVIDLLDGRARRREGAPGVYVDGAKIAALGIRVRQGRAYHGLALNVGMDLSPFSAINPCGYPGLAVTQTRDLGLSETPMQLGRKLAASLIQVLEHA
jgi:lipoyl(octanoyl) transferase